MMDRLAKILGVGVVLFAVYTLILIIGVLFHIGDNTWGDIVVPVLLTGGFFGLIVLGYFFGKDKEDEENSATTAVATSSGIPRKRPYNDLLDTLKFTVYRQTDKTWWNDDYGDYNYHDTYYAHLRFFDDGTVIGNRRKRIPHLGDPDSYSLKGTWNQVQEQLTVVLEKCSNIDETIDPMISAEEQRSMKYAGHISDDDSLIKAGSYTGRIREDRLEFGSHVLHVLPTSELIITADESVCDRIESHYQHHPLVVSSFGDTGNWYTNGETGPEWFTVHLRCASDDREALDAVLEEDGKVYGWSWSNAYWG